jgi:hypothetical protein
VFRIEDILAVFPDAKILCCVRSAPAMIASYRQWGLRASHDLAEESQSEATRIEKRRARDSYHPAIASLLWKSAVRQGFKGQKLFGNEWVRLVHYEALVSNAETTIADIASGWENLISHKR